ncbi:MAG: succinate dehydrogenase cytochrome b subunit [Candidatus Marinimicrobia bacterium]|nr:succinate dehydrogenase cytochrome b subunit [Candidatus Neomarinimicrobiota bacterium]
MGWMFDFLNSSIGKKIQMAITGVLLCLFLIIHLIGNLFLFAGPHAFNTYVETLSAVRPIVRSIELILTLIFLGHIFNGIRLIIANRQATSVKYAVNKARENSTIVSRTMGITGSVIFIFLAVHLSTIWYTFQLEHGGGKFFDIVMSNNIGFGNLIVTIFYMIAMFLLGFHLRHGFQSAFQTFGWNHTKYKSIIEVVAVFFWLILPVGFLMIPLYFGLLGGGN